MDQVLGDSMNRIGQVVKTRHLYMCKQTRIHVDRVDNLGDFMELEVCFVNCISLNFIFGVLTFDKTFGFNLSLS